VRRASRWTDQIQAGCGERLAERGVNKGLLFSLFRRKRGSVHFAFAQIDLVAF
jgi:hypothetical protein